MERNLLNINKRSLTAFEKKYRKTNFYKLKKTEKSKRKKLFS